MVVEMICCISDTPSHFLEVYAVKLDVICVSARLRLLRPTPLTPKQNHIVCGAQRKMLSLFFQLPLNI